MRRQVLRDYEPVRVIVLTDFDENTLPRRLRFGVCFSIANIRACPNENFVSRDLAISDYSDRLLAFRPICFQPISSFSRIAMFVALELWEAHDLGREDSGLFQHPCGLIRHTGRATHSTLARLEWRQCAAPATMNSFHLFIPLFLVQARA